MTYATLRRYPPTVTDAELELSWTPSERIIDLDHFARWFYPHEVVAWARDVGRPVHWVDNDWVRVEISRADLHAFAVRIGAGDDVGALIAGIEHESGRLFIEVEAY